MNLITQSLTRLPLKRLPLHQHLQLPPSLQHKQELSCVAIGYRASYKKFVIMFRYLNKMYIVQVVSTYRRGFGFFRRKTSARAEYRRRRPRGANLARRKHSSTPPSKTRRRKRRRRPPLVVATSGQSGRRRRTTPANGEIEETNETESDDDVPPKQLFFEFLRLFFEGRKRRFVFYYFSTDEWRKHFEEFFPPIRKSGRQNLFFSLRRWC